METGQLSDFVEVIVGPGLRAGLDELFEAPLREAADRFTDELADEWKEMALRTRSYRSGAYFESIHVDRRDWLEGENRLWDVIADVDHAQRVEFLLRHVPGYLPEGPGVGRFPAKLAIEAMDGRLEEMLEEAVRTGGQKL